MLVMGMALCSAPAMALDTVAKPPMSIDSMDKTYEKLKKQSDSLKQKIETLGEKIDDKRFKKVNYWIPIAGGAVLGIGLAWWLRRRKKQK
jgi:LPXTG-motif cell wall-anchored protein